MTSGSTAQFWTMSLLTLPVLKVALEQRIVCATKQINAEGEKSFPNDLVFTVYINPNEQ